LWCYSDGFGGKYQYQCKDNPNTFYTGYRTINSAYKGWLKDNFGENTHTGILKLIKVNKPKIPYLGQKDLNHKEFLKIINKQKHGSIHTSLHFYFSKCLYEGNTKLVVVNNSVYRDFKYLIEARDKAINSSSLYDRVKAANYSIQYTNKAEYNTALLNRLIAAFGVLSCFKDDGYLINLHKEYVRLVNLDKEIFDQDILKWLGKYNEHRLDDTLYKLFLNHYESKYIQLLYSD
jgi:hypothetical protein